MDAHSDQAGARLVAQLPGRHPGIPAARTPARHPSARTRGTARPVPELRTEYAHLDLEGLRTYRAALQAEESKVSYWRRIIQARLDVVREGRTAGGTGTLDAAHLRPVLTERRVSAGRSALVQVVAVDDIPPLPDLAELWERQVGEDDVAGLEGLEHDLSGAEAQLSAYRAALHRRLGEATGELIARYREQPGLCLTALPLPPAARAVRA